MHSSQPMCPSMWASLSAGRRHRRRCTTTIIGIGNDYHFAEDAAARNCSVHAHDPTTNLHWSHLSQARRLRNVTFHFSGLTGGGGNGADAIAATASRNASRGGDSVNGYGTVDGSVLRTLSQLTSANPAGQRHIDVLSIDCEGCEWGALEQIAGDAPSLKLMADVRLLFVEVHVSPTMVPPTLRQFVMLFDVIVRRLGFRLWYANIRAKTSARSIPLPQCTHGGVLVRQHSPSLSSYPNLSHTRRCSVCSAQVVAYKLGLPGGPAGRRLSRDGRAALGGLLLRTRIRARGGAAA